MADLIDRAPMLEFLDLQHYDKDMQVTQYSPDWIYSWLESQPAVDAVPVIRCKDCDYYENGECECPYIFTNDETHIYPDLDDFCSYGRRIDADN